MANITNLDNWADEAINLITGLEMTAGAGITGGTGTVYKTGVTDKGAVIYTSMLIDLTGLDSVATLGDIIGTGTSAAHLGQVTADVNGTVFAGRMTCLEVPTTGDDDVDLYFATEATGALDGAVGDLAETALVTSAGAWTLNGSKAFAAVPAANSYLYLTAGAGDTAGTYDAGKFLIEMWGY